MKIRFFLIFLFVLGITSCKNDSICLVGDHFVLSLIEKGDTAFLFNKLTSQKLFYLLDKDATALSSNKTISSSIKNSNKIVMSVGLFDIIPCFDFSSKSILVNKDLLKNKLELFDYYIYHSFSLINEINKNNQVYIFQQINPLVDSFSNLEVFTDALDSLNTILFTYSKENNFEFVTLDNYSFYLNDDFSFSSSYSKFINDKL